MTVQPDFPAFASLEALLIIVAKKSTREFVLGQIGILMSEQNYSNFAPAWAAECRAGRKEEQGFSLRSLLAEPHGSNQDLTSRTGVFSIQYSGASCAQIPYSGTIETGSQRCRPARASPECLLFIFVSYLY